MWSLVMVFARTSPVARVRGEDGPDAFASESRPPVDVLVPPPSVPSTKRALLVLSHAMERAFDTAPPTGDRPGLVLGFFQLREHFDVERDRYGSLAAAGHTVVVAFAGPVDGLPEDVHAVQLAADDPRARDWVLVAVRDAYATSLVAHDVHAVVGTELTYEGSRSFDARWTFRRGAGLRDAREQLARLPELPGAVRDAATAHVDRSAGLPVLPGEAQLAVAADHLVASLDRSHRRTSRLRAELEDTQSLAERDQLTGLHNRHHLERYLGGGGDRPADLLVLLVDVDDLKAVNDGHGHAAGDAVLRAVATCLRAHSRPGDVCVRWGGDEFLLLAPYTDAGAGLAFATRLAEAVRATRAPSPWDGLRLSVSIGVCPTDRTVLPLARLDAALHSVKRTGKGRAALPPAALAS